MPLDEVVRGTAWMLPLRFQVAMARRSLSASPGGKAGADDGDLHRLLLEQRHAVGAFEHGLELVGGYSTGLRCPSRRFR